MSIKIVTVDGNEFNAALLTAMLVPESTTELHHKLCMQVFVSNIWQFIYVRNPKSSSTAVLDAITQQLCGGECVADQLREVRRWVELEPVWSRYFVFTVVRNPWTRMLSAYNMFHEGYLFKYDPCI